MEASRPRQFLVKALRHVGRRVVMVVWEHWLKDYIVVLDISYLLREDEKERGLASLTVPLE